MNTERITTGPDQSTTDLRKRIIVVNRYFWPETILINYISVWLVEEGYRVTVITGQPDYHPDANIPLQPRSEIWNGVEIKRLRLFRDSGRGILRNLNTQLFTLLATLHVLFASKPDLVWCTTIPPVLQPFLLRIVTKLRRCKFVYFIQDIYPEIIIAAGLVRESWITRLVCIVDNWTIRASDSVITISNDMQEYIQCRIKSKKEIDVCRSFSTDQNISDVVSAGDKKSVKFIFAGNIGRFQNLEKLVHIFSEITSVQLILLGNGREKERLVSIVQKESIKNVSFYDHMPSTEAYNFIRQCDIGIVTLREGIFKFAYPAKTYTYLGAGLPLLVFVEDESELHAIVNDRGIGQALSWSETHQDVRLAIEDLVENLEHYNKQVGDNTADMWDQDRARGEWINIIANTLRLPEEQKSRSV